MSVNIAILFCLFTLNSVASQFVWKGDNYEIRGDSIHLNAKSSGVSVAKKAIQHSDTAIWKFNFKVLFSPSSNNRFRYYLFSDDSVPQHTQNGLFLEVGENGSDDGLIVGTVEHKVERQLMKLGEGLLSSSKNYFEVMLQKKDSSFSIGLLADTVRIDSIFSFSSYDESDFELLECTYTSSNVRGFQMVRQYSAGANWPTQWLKAQISSYGVTELLYEFGSELTWFDSVEVSSSSIEVQQALFYSSQLHIFLNSLVESNKEYVFSVFLQGEYGKALTQLSYERVITSAGSLVINEILLDPNGSVSNHSFTGQCLELKNECKEAIQLRDLKICVESNCFDLPSVELMPDAYLVLSEKTEQIASLQTVQLDDWNKLPKDRGCIYLKNQAGDWIDQFCYDIDLLNNDYRKDGGVSIERSEDQAFCSRGHDWCSDFRGTTFGGSNSASPTEIAFQLEHLSYNGDVVKLHFNQMLQEGFQVEVEPAIDFLIDSAKRFRDGIIQLRFKGELSSDVDYQIKIRDVYSLCGSLYGVFSVDVGRLSASGQGLLINEVMYDPAEGFAEYIEIYNASEAFVSMNELYLSVGGREGAVAEKVYFLSNENAFFSPKSYHVFHRRGTKLQRFSKVASTSRVHSLHSFPSLVNAGSCIKLLNSAGVGLDSLCYDESWHSELAVTKGVALERLEFFKADRDRGALWTSSSTESGGGTPTYKNSISNLPSTNELKLSAKYFDITEGVPLFLEFNTGFASQHCVVKLFDRQGQLVSLLIEGQELLGQGQLELMNEATTYPTGVYILYAEVADIEGRIERIKQVISIR